MIDEQWRAAWNVYELACELPAGERRAFVESELHDPAWRNRILALLESQDGQSKPDPDGCQSGSERPKGDEWPHLGKTIGHFLITTPLGRGGMGDVYAAHDLELNRAVALKFLSSAAIGTVGVERFIREAQAASALNHPGIVTVHEVISFESSSAIVMELVEGQSFRGLCRTPNPPGRVAEWGRQMSQALAVAHSHNIVHRDMKPENLILRTDNLVKILDFGIARDLSNPDALDTIPLGTLGYMSPEQIACEPVTSAADVFSLGIILFELTMGAHPFLAATAARTSEAIARLDPASLRIPGASRVGRRDLDTLVRSMLAKDPKRRPDAAAVALELSRITRRSEGGIYKRALRVAIPVLAVGLAAAAWWTGNHRAVTSPNPPQVSQFTSLEGNEVQPAVSPDGRMIAFVWDGPDGSNQDIYIQESAAETPKRLTTDPAEDSNPAWSPDGKEIAFLRRTRAEGHTVMIMNAAGGQERAVGRIAQLEYFHGVLAWWPDGKSLIVRDQSAGTVGFVRMIPATGKKIPLTAPSGTDRDSDVATSPDGRRIAFFRRKGSTLSDSICYQNLPDGQPECFPSAGNPSSLVWWNQGKEILTANGGTIWRVAAGRNVTANRVKVLDGDYFELAGDRAGHRLVASRASVDTNLWRVRRHGEARVKLISSTLDESDAQYAPDGERIVFRSNRLGFFELWMARKDGTAATRLTKLGGRAGSARWSPDGKSIAFDCFAAPSERLKNTNIFAVPADGGPVRRLTDDRTIYFVPNWSQDGRWIYFIKQNGTTWETAKVPSQGGAPVLVSSKGMFDIVESADGRYLYYTTPRGAAGIWRRPVEGGEETLVKGTEKVGLYRYWQLTRDGLYFVEGPANPIVQFLSLKTGAITRLASLGPQLRKGPRGFDVSPDGASFLYLQDDATKSNLYLIDGIS